MSLVHTITSFYVFQPFDEDTVERLSTAIIALGGELELCGSVILGVEGCNATVSGTAAAISTFKVRIAETLDAGALDFKDSESQRAPFSDFKVTVRQEIVTIGKLEKGLQHERDSYLSPREWQEMIEKEDVVVLDTRNYYETDLGIFTDALDLRLDSFREFPDAIRDAAIPKDKKVLMYCTGGIRCEKAALEMERQGYEDVHQLHGGILRYLEEFPNSRFDGECFVFDYRVAVDQELKPSDRYRICPHCGDPGDQTISCLECNTSVIVCSDCLNTEWRRTCTKNCAHHYRRKRGLLCENSSS